MIKNSSLKRGTKSLKKSKLKQSNPITAKKKQAERKLLREEDYKFYEEIWNSKEHVCDLSGQYLGQELQIIFFHHLLPKEKYPEFRHKKWNILMCLGKLHAQIEINPYQLPEKEYDRFIGFLAKAKYKAGID